MPKQSKRMPSQQVDVTTDGLYSPEEVAELLKIDTRTLSNWRYQGKGPVFTKLGGIVRYTKFDVNNFVYMSRQAMTGSSFVSSQTSNS
jgi:predicted site-specific integrase-resolvase